MNLRPTVRRRSDAAAGTPGGVAGWARLRDAVQRRWRMVALAGAILVVAGLAFSADPAGAPLTPVPEVAMTVQPSDRDGTTASASPTSSPEPAASATTTTPAPAPASTSAPNHRPDPYIRDFAQQPGVAPLPPQPSPTAGVALPLTINGCDNNYGQVGQCVPLTFPSSVTDKCAWLAARGLVSIPVNGTDRHSLDPDGDGTACEPDEGD